MKKNLVFVFSTIILFCSCRNLHDNMAGGYAEVIDGTFSSSETVVENESNPWATNQANIVKSKYELIRQEYPDKVILTWAVTPYFSLADSVRVDKINEHLDSLGKDYAVCFISIPIDMATFDYYAGIDALVQSGENVDIISSQCLSYMAHCGYYAPISDYLLETKIGCELYDLMPENYWKTCYTNGEVFGVGNPLHVLNSGYCYYYNAELVEKYNYDIDKSPLEQIDILMEINKNEDCTVFLTPNSMNYTVPFTNDRNLELPLYWDDGENKMRCAFDNEEFLERVRTIYELRTLGLVSYTDYGFADSGFFIYAATEDFLPNNDANINIRLNEKMNPVECIRKDLTEGYAISDLWYCNGLAAISTNKDEAFDLLATCYIDSYLSNLLLYGVEGEDYTIADGRVDGGYNIQTYITFGNNLLCLPNVYQPIDLADQLRAAIELAHIDNAIEFKVDRRTIQERLMELDIVMNAFSDEAALGGNDFWALVEKYRKNLYEAGIAEIIDEVNRQYLNWSENR